ncbi:thrombopoietin receptor [Melanotaenia boesemani]|uniref:thrombopoietin receptor n=1 Tax=Melanotaenia boesemani TaxID=1250792 RepID=UPI001C03E6E3|nr:thrombopoietin receptor [Melanotaenia boesemani]
MKSICMWKRLLLNLWIHIGFMPGLHCNTGIINHLSKEDVLLLKDEKNPKCFTRREEDFTCFFETTDNKTYELLYKYTFGPMKRCEMSVQRTEEGNFLHICLFPSSDVYTYTEINIQVVECTSNISTYSRSVYVEEHFLLDPPWNVSLDPNGNVGQLQVSWHTEYEKYMEEGKKYRIRYSSNSLGEKTVEAKNTDSCSLVLPPGEVVEVQVALKYGYDPVAGHWSSWSQPVRAAVPQRADDISLACYTSDLHNVVCQWKGQKFGVENDYKLFYKMELGESLNWSNWTECLADERHTDQCSFYGNTSRQMRVKLSSPSAPLSSTFYSEPFMLSNSIKPLPPHHLKYAFRQDKLCLEWEAPLPSPQTNLQYEVDIQTKGEKQRRRIICPETVICEQVPLSSQFWAKIRAKPNESNHLGSWSDWSDILTGYTQPDLGMVHRWGIVVLIPAIATIFICFIGIYHSKLQQYFWPPVPNLEKVLHGFMTEINKHKWDSPVTAKQCFEETTSSVVEIMAEGEVPSLEKLSEESSEFLSLDGSFSSGELATGSPGTEVFPDYVTLNKEIVIACLEGNSYVSELTIEKRDSEVGDERLQIYNCSCTDSSSCVKPYSDFTNHCYLLITESTERFSCKIHGVKGPGNLYTNLPCS